LRNEKGINYSSQQRNWFRNGKTTSKKDWFVFIGSRNRQNGLEAVNALNTEGITNIEAIPLDVTSQASVEAARLAIGMKTDVLNILINNAGILNTMLSVPILTSTKKYMKRMYLA
jgi:NAD(P)-dependent dehydrogenase (short-subunit alcohol dehydrogenase family)